MTEHDVDKVADCPVMLTIGVIGGKWKPRILWLLRSGPMRFSDFTRAIPEKMLAQHLKALESERIIIRREFLDGGAVGTEYSYSDYGRTLIPALDALGNWGLRHHTLSIGAERGAAPD